MRGDQIARQWQLLQALAGRSGGAPARDLARELTVSVRTVYRDLEILERVGIPLVQDREGRQVCWRLLEPRSLRLGPAFSVEEVAALYMARLCFQREGEDTWDEAITRVISKIERVLPRRILARLPELLADGDLTPDRAHRLAVDDVGD